MPSKTNFFNNPGAIIIEGHVQGLSNTRSLGEAGVPVFVIDKTDCIARYSKYCKKFFICPDFVLDEFVDFLIELGVNEEIKGWILIPSNDHAVYTISKHKVKLEKYFKILIPDLCVIKQMYDKTKLIEAAKQVNIPIPKTQLFTSIDEELNCNLNYPVITKGRNGLSFYKAIGKKVLLAKNNQELRKQLAIINERFSIDGTFTQELIPFNGNNYTISFTAFCVDGQIKAHWSGVKLREHPFRFGTATFAKSINNPLCYQVSVPLLEKLRYTGVCEVEYIQDPRDGQLKLIEINPRTWLWVELAKQCGVDYAKIVYDFIITKEVPEIKIDSITRYWYNPVTDTIYSIINIFKGKLSPLTYIKSIIKRNKVNALFFKDDFKPGLMYLLKGFSFFKNR